MQVVLSMAALVGLVLGHSKMLLPKGRGNMEWFGYCSYGQGCQTTCDGPKSDAPILKLPKGERMTVKRGDTIPVEWMRQNHPGGFVRIAMTTFDNSDSKEAFDSNSVKYVCYETNCSENHHDPILGKLNGPGSQKCTTQFTIPDNLPDGLVTLQWTWFGGGIYFADRKTSFANYVSCADMVLKGGLPYKEKRVTPEFQGSDIYTPDKDKCRYWSTNSIHECPVGAEDYNKEGCGYGGQSVGPPKEWLDAGGVLTSANY